MAGHWKVRDIKLEWFSFKYSFVYKQFSAPQASWRERGSLVMAASTAWSPAMCCIVCSIIYGRPTCSNLLPNWKNCTCLELLSHAFERADPRRYWQPLLLFTKARWWMDGCCYDHLQALWASWEGRWEGQVQLRWQHHCGTWWWPRSEQW